MTQENKRALTLHYQKDWIRITGEGYDTTFTYAKAANFLNDFFMLETEAKQGPSRLALSYVDEGGTPLGTAHLVILRLPANSKQPERCELIPDFESLSADSKKNDLLLSGISVIHSDYSREKASLFSGSSLIDITVGRTTLSIPPARFDLISTQCQQGRIAENTAIEQALKAMKTRYVAFPHVLCEVNRESGKPYPLSRFSNSLRKGAKFSDTRYLPYSIGFKSSLLVAELEKVGYPRNWLININAFTETQRHCINPLIKASPTFHIDDVQFLDNEAVYEAAVSIRRDAISLIRDKLIAGLQDNKTETTLRSMLSVTNNEERCLIFEAALTMNGEALTDNTRQKAICYGEQYASNTNLDLTALLNQSETPLTAS